MGARVLSGSKLIVVSTDEFVRAEAYAALSIEGWEIATAFATTADEIRRELTGEEDRTIAILLERKPLEAERLFAFLSDGGLSPSQIVFGCIPNSLTHRLIARARTESFPFQYTVSAIGPKIDLSGLPSKILNAWKNTCSLQLDTEIRSALESGALALIRALCKVDSVSTLKERAHLVAGLASCVNENPSFRKRCIRLALYRNIASLPAWSEMVSEWKSAWPVREMLDFCAQHEATLADVSSPWPAKTPMEVILVETACTYQRLAGANDQIQDTLRTKASLLPLPRRTSLNLAVDAAFKRLWVKKHEAA